MGSSHVGIQVVVGDEKHKIFKEVDLVGACQCS